jgi:site-specific DNA-methyltransferase (adenine-specific)
VPDVLEAPRIRNGYPTEKPASVSQVLVKQSSSAGERVIDPFVGAGSVGMAAVALGREFLGNDLSPTALEVARARLTAAGGADHSSERSTLVTGVGQPA